MNRYLKTPLSRATGPLWIVAILMMLAMGGAVGRLHADGPPNIIYIMSDDMGFSDLGCYGSEIETPNLDSLATGGIRFTQFYNTARCCPTRASLLTGLYPHQAGIGHMMDDRGHDGYRGELNRHCVTIGEVLKGANYRCYVTGKWHVTSKVNVDSIDQKFNWPLQRGFDRFYGTIHGAGSFWDPNSLTRDNATLSPFNDPLYPKNPSPHEGSDDPNDFFYTDAISDHAVKFIHDHHQETEDQPFFMYVAFTAAHWPMHARPKDIAKYAGRYDAGYAAIRKARFEKMIRLGLVDAETTTNPPIPEDWMDDDLWELDRRSMEVYAAMIDNMDQGVGRIIESLKDTGQYENTLICFFQDNGGCAEEYGRGPQQLKDSQVRADKPTLEPMTADQLQRDMQPKQTRDGYPVRVGKEAMPGTPDTYMAYGKVWATVSNTPFREYKHWVHEGGISSPLIVHWPDHIDRPGTLEKTPAHLIDLMATAVDVGSAEYPETYHDGQSIYPMEGRSLAPLFRVETSSPDAIKREALYWEHEGNRAIRVGDEKLVAKGANGPWELYNIRLDRNEKNNLADAQPERVKHLAAMWQSYAERAHVLPLNPTQASKQPNKVKPAKPKTHKKKTEAAN
jgi:arylsulfatase A-like enzyme